MRNAHLAIVLALAIPTGLQADPPATPAVAAVPANAATPAKPAVAAVRDPSLPPSENEAKAQLEKSPRHGEFIDVQLPKGGKLNAWIVYPERKDKAGVVIVIHEIFGLSDWIRGVADQLAKEGFIAIVPDLVSGLGPNGGGSAEAANRDDVVKLVRALSPEEATARVNAVRDFAKKIPAGNGKIATVGFCWGGGRSFAYAVSEPALAGAVVYYGVTPEPADLAKIHAPVVGFYGGDDARITATLDATKAEMKRLGKTYEANVFDGAGHGFLRAQEDRDSANLRATRAAWPRTLAFLRERLGK